MLADAHTRAIDMGLIEEEKKKSYHRVRIIPKQTHLLRP